MSTPAVTADAPAASPFQTATEHSSFLPSGKDYQQSGSLPAKVKTEEVESREENSPSRAAAPAAAETQETEPTEDQQQLTQEEEQHEQEERTEPQRRGKTRETSESRWAKLSRENRELKDKLARAEGREEGRQQTRTEPSRDPQASQPAAESRSFQPTRPEPKIEDKKADGSSKYANWQEWFNDLRTWDREQAVAEANARAQSQTREQQQEQQRQIINREVNRRVEQARKDYSDYDEVVASGIAMKTPEGLDMVFIPGGSAPDLFLLDSPRGQDVLYTILKDPEKYAAIFAHDAKGNFLMHPVKQLRELSQIEAALPAKGRTQPRSVNSSTSAPARKASQAPPPAAQTSGKGNVARNSAADAVEQNDFSTYRNSANDNDPRLRAFRANRGK